VSDGASVRDGSTDDDLDHLMSNARPHSLSVLPRRIYLTLLTYVFIQMNVETAKEENPKNFVNSRGSDEENPKNFANKK